MRSDLPSPESFKRDGITLDDVRPILRAYVLGRLVDRDTIATPLARKMYERATSQFPPDWSEADQDFWLSEVATVIGGSDEK